MQEIVKGRNADGVPGNAHADLVIGAADSVEFRSVKLVARLSKQRIDRGASADGAERRAVLGGDVVEPVGETDAGRAFHVLRHYGRIAGQVLADVAGQEPRVEVVAASD